MKITSIGLFIFLSFITHSANADWQLDNKGSSLSFVSVKKGTIVESHSFGSLSGSVSNEGQVKIQIDLTSAQTGIPIRNERLADMLFETKRYPEAIITAKINLDSIQILKMGEYVSMLVEAKLNLHGVQLPIEIDLQVMRASKTAFHVQSKKATIIDTELFGLKDGVNALRDIAGLSAITANVPVNFNLHFIE